MLNGSKIITQNDLNIILRRFTEDITHLKEVNQKLSESCNKNESIKRKHTELETSFETETKSVKSDTYSLKNESSIANTKISILEFDIDKLKKENENLREKIEKISKVVNYYDNNFKRLSQIQNLLISKKKKKKKRRKIIRNIERKHLSEIKKNKEEIAKRKEFKELDKRKELDKSIKSETKNLVKNEKVPMAKIIVKSMDELDKKFQEYNNVGGFVTYVISSKMEEMLNKTFEIVRRKGPLNEDGLIGLRPPEIYKDTMGWQNGCWYFPKTCVEEVL